MKWFEWVIVIVFIVMGLLCMGLSGLPKLHADFMGFVKILFEVCFWICVPVVVIDVVYFIWTFIKRKKNN